MTSEGFIGIAIGLRPFVCVALLVVRCVAIFRTVGHIGFGAAPVDSLAFYHSSPR